MKKKSEIIELELKSPSFWAEQSYLYAEAAMLKVQIGEQGKGERTHVNNDIVNIYYC